MLSRLMSLFQEKVQNRYYGKYRALVTDNQDPDHRGRLKVKVPALTGETEIGWAMPCFPYGGGPDRGFYMVPEVGDGVWVEFEAGYLSYPIWSGAWWAQDEAPKGTSGADPVPDVKVIKTTSGHIIQLDDSPGSESVTITDKTGNKLVMNASTIEVDAGSRNLVLKGNSITIEATADLTIKGASVDAQASGVFKIKGSMLDLNP